MKCGETLTNVAVINDWFCSLNYVINYAVANTRGSYDKIMIVNL